jgi:hypothetical protein
MADPKRTPDFSALEEVLGARDSVTAGKSGSYSTYNNDATKLALEVVKNIFPDYLRNNSVKVRGESTRNYGSIADYSLLGHDINIDPDKMQGKWSPSTSQSFPSDPKKPKEVRVNFTTTEVLENVNTLLHELYHSRTGGGWTAGKDRTAAMKQHGISDEILKEAAKMAYEGTADFSSGLYSMKKDYLDVEEFLANAVTMTDMKQRNVFPEAGTLTGKMKTLEAIVAKFPQIGQLIENQRSPDIPTLKSGAPEPGTLGAMLEAIFGGPKTEKATK